MIGIPLGLLYSNAMEWTIHKVLLHGRGKDKKSFWSFHWHEHHNKSRRNDMRDDQYNTPPFRHWDAHTKEATALLAGAAVHLPLLPVAPFFTLAVWWSAAHYYRVHKKSHQDPAWAKEHLPWHVDHHMGPDQHKNWCVTYPLWDRVMGTRVKYLGTERAAQDAAREAARRQQASQPTLSAAA